MKVAIIGAGVSGLSAAYFLLEKDPTLEIEIFEERPEAGGRLATLSIRGKGEVDTGCQYLSIDDPLVFEFIQKVSPESGLKALPGPILCLPEGWVVEPTERFYFSGGMRSWAQNLTQTLQKKYPQNLKIHFEQSVGRIGTLWEQHFDRVLVTAPGRKATQLGSVKSEDYWPCLNIVFAWNGLPWEISEFYAFRDLEMREGVIWLAHEGLKSGNPELWVAQLSPEASREWKNLSLEALDDKITADLAAWVPMFDVGEKSVLSAHFWDQAFPSNVPDPTENKAFERKDDPEGRRLYFFGDGYLGVGRTENAIQSALAMTNDFFDVDLTQSQSS